MPTNVDYNKTMMLEEAEKFHKILNLCDGFILQGGLQTGEHEIYVAKYAIEHDIPLLIIFYFHKEIPFKKKKINRIIFLIEIIGMIS